MDRTFFLIGALSAFVGVAAGAFGAHGLKDRLSAEMLAVSEVGVRYQMYHAFALMGALGHPRRAVEAVLSCGRASCPTCARGWRSPCTPTTASGSILPEAHA